MKNYLKVIEALRNRHLEEQADKTTVAHVPSGVGVSDYRFLIDYILTENPKCIVEYGSGYSTWLLSQLIVDFNLDTILISHESDRQYFYFINNNLKIDRKILHHTPLRIAPEHTTEKYKAVRYLDIVKNYPKVDLVITDGPGPSPLGNFNVTTNYLDIVNIQEGNRPYHWIDGRETTKDFFIEKGFYDTIIHY